MSYLTLGRSNPSIDGDILFLMTDGILEGRNDIKEKFGKERMQESIGAAPHGTAREILDFILGRFEVFMDGALPSAICSILLD